MAKSRAIPALTRQALLKRKLRKHLKELGFTKAEDGSLVQPHSDKDTVRALHAAQRAQKIVGSKSFIAEQWTKLNKHFAAGSEVDPANIKPVLQRITAGTWESELFRLAGLTWSVPISNGFGRRLRYLVWDSNNGKLIGIAALGDPVFNLRVRDNYINWDSSQRTSRLVNILDAYVLGSIPPYSSLLGGKLVACLMRSRDIYRDFEEEYGNTRGIISKKKKSARLLAITTSSSMGRSSVYNRLKLGGHQYFDSIGFSTGWGHFHIPDNLFLELREYLRSLGDSYADQHRFGQGPNWRFRTARQALAALGVNEEILRHGIQREVFLCGLADNSLPLLRDGVGTPDLKSLLSAQDVGSLAVSRWLIPRAASRPEFRAWTRDDLKGQLMLPTSKTNPLKLSVNR